MAWFTDDADLDKSNYQMGTVEVDVDEVGKGCHDLVLSCDGDKKTPRWKIKNQGSLPVYLRVKLTDAKGQFPRGIDWGVTSEGWQEGKNGDEYWYYKNPVAPKGNVTAKVNISKSTNADLADMKLEEGFAELDCGGENNLSVKLLAEAIQEANDAIDTEWPNNPFKSNK